MHHGLLHTDGLDASAHIQEETFRELRWHICRTRIQAPTPTQRMKTMQGSPELTKNPLDLQIKLYLSV